MSHEEPWQRHQRERWTRPDSHLWVRPDSARFFKPGTDLAEIFPEVARQREAEEAAEAKAIAREIEELLALRDELMEVKAELARRRREDEAKYSPTQPRVPAGNPRGGQWTDRSGGGGTVASPSQDAGQSQDADLTLPMGNVDIGYVSGSSELGDLFQIEPSDTRVDGVRVAAEDSSGRYSVDLDEEEARGGHALRRHTERTDSSLIDHLNSDYRRIRTGNLEITEFPEAEGAFASQEQANDLVNHVLRLESDKVDQVANGAKKRDRLERSFESVTGREAFRPNGDSDPYIRDTYGVRVVIKHDSRSPRGYTVVTAFPVN